MTLPEFTLCFAGIAKRYHFEVRKTGEIRGHRGGPVCPITAVANALTGHFFATSMVGAAVRELPLGNKDAGLIVAAADGRCKSADAAKIRRALVAAIKRAA